MVLTDARDNQQLSTAVYENGSSRTRQPSVGLMGSIWAPQPQLSDITWPKRLDCFSRVVSEKDGAHPAPDPRVFTRQQPVIAKDFFGASPQAHKVSVRDVGAIGDGRKKNSPDYDDSVCVFFTQIFRANFFLARRTAPSHAKSQLSSSF